MLTHEGRTLAPRVAFVYPNPRGGLAADVEAGRAPDTTLLGRNHLSELGFEVVVDDAEPRPIGPRVFRRLLWHLREPAVAWRFGVRADVVCTPLADLLPLAARVRGRPRVVVLNYGLCTTLSRSGAARRRALRASLRSASAIVCLGSSQRSLLADQTGLPAERLVTIRLGVDERFFAPQPQPHSDDPLVLAVGKDAARDYATFVEAVRGLGVRAEILCLPRNLDGVRLPERVRARFVDPRTLRALYRDAACVVVPQRRADYPYGSEGGGLTALLEAMASARPVVATRRPIFDDYVDDGRTALLVPPEEPDALSAAITRVLADGALARSLGDAARRSVDAGLTTRRFAEALDPVLKAAAG